MDLTIPEDVTQNFKVHEVDQPIQFPFMHNNALDPKDREMAIFHFAPNFYDHSDLVKKKNYQFADLDDLNTSNPVVRDVLRECIIIGSKKSAWMDTVLIHPIWWRHELWHDFLHSKDLKNPGIIPFPKSLGKEKFLAFGETAFFLMRWIIQRMPRPQNFWGPRKNPK